MFVKIQMLFDFFEIGQIPYIHQKSQNWTKFVLTFLTFIGLCLCFFSKGKPKTETETGFSILFSKINDKKSLPFYTNPAFCQKTWKSTLEKQKFFEF